MEYIREYILSLVTASIIVGIVTAIVKERGTGGTIIRLVSGIFLTLVMLSPVLTIEVQDILGFYNDISLDASASVNAGKIMAREEMHSIIKENLEAYILDKASALQLDVDVDVILTEDLPPSPESVLINGNVSPYNKQVFQAFLNDEIGISKEHQIWQ